MPGIAPPGNRWNRPGKTPRLARKSSITHTQDPPAESNPRKPRARCFRVPRSLPVSAGLIVLAILVFALSMISVPAAVFFPAYSIYFLAARYPALADVVWPRQPGPVAPGEGGLT